MATSLSGAGPLAASPDATKGDPSAPGPRPVPPAAAPVPAKGAQPISAAKGAKADSAEPHFPAPPATSVPIARDTPPKAAAVSDLGVALGARVGLEPLLLKSATTLVSGVASLQSERLKAELALGGSYPESYGVSGGGSAVTQLLTAGLAACYGGPAGDFRFWGCVGGELGRFSATGENITRSKTAHELWSAGLVRGELSRELSGHFALVVGAEGVLVLQRIRVVESNPTTAVYTTGKAVTFDPGSASRVDFDDGFCGARH